jgi:putative phosphoesterase
MPPSEGGNTNGTDPAPLRVGLVADTHGTADPRLATALAGVARIIHAGDIGDERVLRALELIAPVTAVRGNVDEGDLRRDLPVFTAIDVAGVRFVITHIRDRGFAAEDARRIGADVFVFAHTHVPFANEGDGLLEINPGSASRGRSGHPRSIAIVEVEGGMVTSWEILPLDGVSA